MRAAFASRGASVLTSPRLLPVEASVRVLRALRMVLFRRSSLRLSLFLQSLSGNLVPMTLRNRFLITAAVLCHLLLVPPLVTSQLPPANAPAAEPRAAASAQASAEKPATAPSTPCALAAAAQKEKGDVRTICAIQQEEEGSVYKLHGAVEIYYGTYILRADEATYNSDTREATGTGHFALDGGPNDDHIRASHGTYNLDLETGRFYDVTGTTGLVFRGNQVILTSTAPSPLRAGLSTRLAPIITWSTTAPSLPASCLILCGDSTRAR